VCDIVIVRVCLGGWVGEWGFLGMDRRVLDDGEWG
jgi:hypothetical protein